ncbi:hypothetical protein cypCar_00049739 [Cyprinus carpio]|nr:hypothetical protein cypCar_00049739 [Cyprinus carpio]
MTCTLEKVLADAKSLVERLRDHDSAAEILIEQTTLLNKRVEAMKQYQEEIEVLNQVARHRPRSTLVMGIQQENRQIRDLQQENKELRIVTGGASVCAGDHHEQIQRAGVSASDGQQERRSCYRHPAQRTAH